LYRDRETKAVNAGSPLRSTAAPGTFNRCRPGGIRSMHVVSAYSVVHRADRRSPPDSNGYGMDLPQRGPTQGPGLTGYMCKYNWSYCTVSPGRQCSSLTTRQASAAAGKRLICGKTPPCRPSNRPLDRSLLQYEYGITGRQLGEQVGRQIVGHDTVKSAQATLGPFGPISTPPKSERKLPSHHSGCRICVDTHAVSAVCVCRDEASYLIVQAHTEFDPDVEGKSCPKAPSGIVDLPAAEWYGENVLLSDWAQSLGESEGWALAPGPPALS
jgi:hypothetical protein